MATKHKFGLRGNMTNESDARRFWRKNGCTSPSHRIRSCDWMGKEVWSRLQRRQRYNSVLAVRKRANPALGPNKVQNISVLLASNTVQQLVGNLIPLYFYLSATFPSSLRYRPLILSSLFSWTFLDMFSFTHRHLCGFSPASLCSQAR